MTHEKTMHKDQRRIKSSLLPRVMDRVMGETPEDERDCTVLNRCFLQGPDPLLLRELCPNSFGLLCNKLGMTRREGHDAIEQAHWHGPGVLIEWKGAVCCSMPPDVASTLRNELGGEVPAGWKREALWLYLAALSDTTEEDYPPDVLLVDRLRRVVTACSAFDQAVQRGGMHDPWDRACDALKKFDAACNWRVDEQGILVCDEDAGFYCAYRRGYKVAGVRHGNKVFYGTIPGTTLDEQGVKVDEKVSESYGFVRNGGGSV